MKKNKANQFIQTILWAIYDVYLQTSSRLNVITIGKCGESFDKTYEAALLHERYKSMQNFQ